MNWTEQIRCDECNAYFHQRKLKKYLGKTPVYLNSLYATSLDGVCVQSCQGDESFDPNIVIVQQDGDIRTTKYYSAKIDDIDEIIQQYKIPLNYQRPDRMDLFLAHLKNNKRSDLQTY